LGQRADPTALREHRLEHRKDRIGSFGRGLVAYQIRKLFATRIDRAHVAAKVVHQDFGRVDATVEHFCGNCVVGAFLLFERRFFLANVVEEALHNADVFVVVHHLVFHDYPGPLKESGCFCARRCGQAR
jgi:hypothetical protein